ncbi:MAG: DUF402 domain-containing protein [Nocardioidaceae bacterium]
MHGPVGARWEAPGDTGVLRFPIVVLLAPERPWVAWWVNDPDDRRLEIDVCLPPWSIEQGWSYVDLELDPVRHESNASVTIEDWDEYDQSVRDGWMSTDEANLARSVAEERAQSLCQAGSMWQSGWELLTTLTM